MSLLHSLIIGCDYYLYLDEGWTLQSNALMLDSSEGALMREQSEKLREIKLSAYCLWWLCSKAEINTH